MSISRTTIMVLVLVLLGAVAALGAYGWEQAYVVGLESNASALDASISALEAKERQVAQLRTGLAATEVSQAEVQSYFVDANDPVPLFDAIEKYAADSGAGVSIDSATIAHAPDRLSIQFTAEGSWKSIYRFLALIQAMPYEITVDSATVSSVPVTAASGTKIAAGPWEAHIGLSVLSVTGIVPGQK